MICVLLSQRFHQMDPCESETHDNGRKVNKVSFILGFINNFSYKFRQVNAETIKLYNYTRWSLSNGIEKH